MASNLLFVHYAGLPGIRGSERCLLDLLSHLDRGEYQPIVWCNTPAMAEAVTALGIPVELSPMQMLFDLNGPHFAWGAYRQQVQTAKRLIDKYQIALIHANSAAPTQWLAGVAKSRGLPLLCHLHTHYDFSLRLRLRLHEANMLVGINPHILASFAADGMAQTRLQMVLNGIDTERLLAPAEDPAVEPINDLNELSKDLLPADICFAAAGALTAMKGHDLLISAVANLHQQGIKAQLLIMGQGEERENLQAQITTLGLTGYVLLLGEQAHPVSILRTQVDVFVSASRLEAFGLVFAEAGLVNLPCIAPRVGGIPLVVKHGQTGLLFAPESVSELTAAMRQLNDNPDLRQTLGQAAGRHIRQHFTIQQHVAAMSHCYQRLLAGDLAHAPDNRPLFSQIRALGHYLYAKLAGKKPRVTQYA